MLKAETDTSTVYYTRGFELISRKEGTVASYYVYDGGLSVRALTNEAGTVTDTLVTDSFGNETGRTGTTDNPYGFQGEEQDATGLYYLRARYMDPATGTFTTMDTYGGSLSDPMSLHKYLFANSNPIMYSDPSGHFSLVEFELSEAIDEILMSSISFGMAYLGMVNDNPNMSDTEKFTGYLVALGLGALFPFGIALLNTMVSIIVAGYVLAGLSLVLTVTSSGIDHDKHPTVGALLDIAAGATWGASLSYLGLAFTQNAKKSSELIHLEAESNATDCGHYDDVNQQIADYYTSEYNERMNPVGNAENKGYVGIGTTPNGGPNYSGTKYIYVLDNGKEAIVTIHATGSRTADFSLANQVLGLPETPSGYTWHHMDNYNFSENTFTLQLVRTDAHRAACPHSGGCAQFTSATGIFYQ